MKLSMNWLNDFVSTADINIKEYCDKMTDSGSKVEGYKKMSDVSGIIAGKILSVSPHPDAERLVVCKVDIGKDEAIQIVTAAKNVYEGAVVPVSVDGAILADGTKIKKSKLRGVVSEGMFCSIEELGLTLHDMPGAVEDGILIFGECSLDYIKPGDNVMDSLLMNDDIVEFEITSNRADCLSVIGLARESGAAFDRPVNIPSLEIKDTSDNDSIENYLSVNIDSPDLCNRYSAKVIKNVRIAPSPLWMRMRLKAAGVRPINNIVDITNYVMLEYGQPMHAFDYTCLEGKHIIVRRAQNDEKYISLDSKEHTLDSSMLVIADEKKPVALAGIMGGANSGISDTTKTVVFESAMFNGGNVRITGKKLGMRTESSSRFEKGLDSNGTMDALMRACQLVQELDAGDVVDGTIDQYPSPRPVVTLPLDYNKINRFLGTDLSSAEMENILKKLYFKVENGQVSAPSFRTDIECMNDIAEEVIRIYGYNKINSTGFKCELSQGKRTPKQNFSLSCARTLTGLGLDQIETFSFISPKWYDKINLDKNDNQRNSIVIRNPLGEDTSVMRTTAIPSMLEVLAENYSKKNLSVLLYEMASVYIPTTEGELPKEPRHITVGFYNTNDKEQIGFYKVKGIIEALFETAGIPAREYRANTSGNTFHPGRTADIYCGDVYLGIIGEIHPSVCSSYDFNCPVTVCELDLDNMYSVRKTDFDYKPLPKHPALERDFSFVCDEELEAGTIEKAIKSSGVSILESVKLFDVYRGNQIGEGKKSLSFALNLRAPDRTLNDEEADKAALKILHKLEKDFGVILRS